MEDLPPVVLASLQKMDDAQRLTFESTYHRQKVSSKGLMVVLAIIFPIQHFLLGKTGLGIAFWLTGGGFLVWWFIEIFLVSRRVNEYNAAIATNIARDLRLMT